MRELVSLRAGYRLSWVDQFLCLFHFSPSFQLLYWICTNTACHYPFPDFCFNFSISDDTRTLAAFVLSGSHVIVISIMSPSRQSPRNNVGILNVTGLLSCEIRTAKGPSILSIVAFISITSIYCSHMLSHFCQHLTREYRLSLGQCSNYNMPVQRLVLKSLHSCIG